MATPRPLLDKDEATCSYGLETSCAEKPAPASVPRWAILTAGILSTPACFVGMVLLRSVLVTVLAVESVWVLAPLVVVRAWPCCRKDLRHLWPKVNQRPGVQAVLGFFCFVVCIIAPLVLLRVTEGTLATTMWNEFARVKKESATYALTTDRPLAVGVFSVWLMVVNPVLEELFWRLFLSEMLGRLTPRHSTLSRWLLCSVLYASYHSTVLFIFCSKTIAAISLAGLVVVGLAFQLLTDWVGIFASMGAHAGGDALVVLLFTESLWHYLERFGML